MASNRGSGINPDPVELVLSRLRERGCRPRQSNSRPGQWSARCPSHGDRKASLSVGTGDDGRVLLKCHKSCSYEAIATALDIQPLDLHPRDHQGRRLTSVRYDKLWQAIDAQAKNLGGDHVATYHYVHADGLEAFVMARYHTAKGKEIRPFCRNRTGRWKVKAPEKNRPVYRLRELIQANRIFVFEGEKCTDLARDRLGLVATTSAFGAQNPKRTDWSPLAGKEVSIVPDCGEPGRAYARQVARSLANLDPAPSVKVVNLPGLEEGEDLEQWLERQPADRTRDQIIEAFESLVAASAGPPKYDGLPTAEQRAIDLIREVLADGMVASQELEDRVVAAGISRRTYDRARPKAGVRSKQIGRRHHSYLHVEPRAPTASRGNASKNTKPKANRKTQDATEVTSGRQHKSRPSGRQDAIQDAKPSNYVEKEKDPSLGNGTGLNPSETGLDPLLPDISLYPPDPDATGRVGFHRDPIAPLDPCGPSKIEVLATDDRADEQGPVSTPVLELAAELTPARAPAATPAPVPEPSPGPTPAPTTEPPLPPPSRSELSSPRWGPDDPTPGILIDRPDRDRSRAVLEPIPDPSAAAEREAIQAESRVESGLPAEAPDALSAPVWPDPALALYRLIRDHGEAASRPVRTPDGPGQLWQMFAARAGVVLDAAPGRVAFFDPSQITSARPPGEACAPATPVDPGQEAQGGRAGSPPGSGPS